MRGHKPDVLILDLNMPGGPSIGAIPEPARASPETGIVVLTMESEPAYAREAIQSGVLGYVLKEAVDEELVTAVRLAAAGQDATCSPSSARGWPRTRRRPPTGSRTASSTSCA